MSATYQPVIGLEIHAVLETQSKMFCDCPVLDSTAAAPNQAVCPVCAAMPGVLPVINQAAVEYALRVALALECEIQPVSIFARKSYFYPDLPKGYQISQYDQPLARNGRITIETGDGPQVVRIRRVHLEEDTGKLTHVQEDGQSYSLVDLNRAGIPLLEIVTEPDLHSAEAVRACAHALRSTLRYLEVNSGDLEKGLFRIEPNISIRPVGSEEYGTRVEVKNLNSFRALERSVAFEIERQAARLDAGQPVVQQTVGWDDARQETIVQRGKEDAEDYRYFPEPDLPPLVVSEEWIEAVRAGLPELPHARRMRFIEQYELPAYDADLLTAERAAADYFEAVVVAAPKTASKTTANWISGELFAWLNEHGQPIEELALPPAELAALLELVSKDEVNQNTAKSVLAKMLAGEGSAEAIVAREGLAQLSDADAIAALVGEVLAANSAELAEYRAGKDSLRQWFFGQVMRAARGRANPAVVQVELARQLEGADG